MSTNEKAMARTMAVSKTTTSASRHSTTSTLPYWLASLSTTAVCVVNLAAQRVPSALTVAGLNMTSSYCTGAIKRAPVGSCHG